METKAALQRLEELTSLINPKALTQENIEKYAKEISDSIASPLVASIGLKTLEILIEQIRKNMSEKVMTTINNMPDSQKRIGNITFDTAKREEIDYKQDPKYAELLKPLDDRKKELQKAYKEAQENGSEFSLPIKVSKYYRVKIPKT